MVAREPKHLVGVVKACPRPGCRSTSVKWRYYNNCKLSQPRYECLDCKNLFTFGGKTRLSKEEKQAAALREAQAAAAAAVGVVVKRKARTKITSVRSSPPTLRAVMESHPKRRISSRNYQPVLRPASPICTAKNIKGSFRLRLSTGNVMDLLPTSSDEETEVEAAAGMSSSVVMPQQGEFKKMVGLDLKSELVDDDDDGLGSRACTPDNQLNAVEDGGPAFSWTSSEQLRGPIVRCVGSSEPELQDSEKESLLIDTGLSSLRSWVDVYT